LSEVNRNALIGSFVIFIAFFLALAVLDFQVMHATAENWPDWVYKYWISLAFVVVIFAAATTWIGHSYGMPDKQLPALFSTVILLFLAGLLDMFYYLLTVLKGENYNFDQWSAQHKWFVVTGLLPEWTWNHQIIWMTACFAIIAVIWWRTLRK